MGRSKTFLSLLLAVGILAAPLLASAATPGKYQAILDRNAFALKDPPPPAPPPEPPPAPEPPIDVFLTGITTLFGKDRAYFKVLTKGEKEPEYPALRVGEKQGGIELLAINLDKGEVKVMHKGRERILSFKENGLAPSAPSAAPAGPPGANPATAGHPPYDTRSRHHNSSHSRHTTSRHPHRNPIPYGRRVSP